MNHRGTKSTERGGVSRSQKARNPKPETRNPTCSVCGDPLPPVPADVEPDDEVALRCELCHGITCYKCLWLCPDCERFVCGNCWDEHRRDCESADDADISLGDDAD